MPFGRALCTGVSLQVRVSLCGIIRVGDVADHHVACAELGAGIPGSVCRDSVLGNHGRGDSAAYHGPNCRLVWLARGLVPALHNLWVGLRGFALGQASDYQSEIW